jgi:Sap, sulfolipid-1-addressing protein
MHASATVVFYAMIAAASPLALTTTFVVLRSERPRTNGIAFLAGYLFGSTVACILGLIAGQAAVTHLDSHKAIEHVVTILLGLALIAFGLRSRTKVTVPVAEQSSRAAAILEGLRHVGPAAAFSTAGLLGFGGPKRLLLTFLAMATINEAKIDDVENLALVALYIATATVLVWVPVGIVIIAGERAAVLLERGEAWLTTHAGGLRVWLSLGTGVALVAVGIVRFFA